MAQKIQLPATNERGNGWHVEGLAEVAESHLISLHGFTLLASKTKDDTILEHLKGLKVCPAVWSGFAPVDETRQDRGLDQPRLHGKGEAKVRELRIRFAPKDVRFGESMFGVMGDPAEIVELDAEKAEVVAIAWRHGAVQEQTLCFGRV